MNLAAMNERQATPKIIHWVTAAIAVISTATAYAGSPIQPVSIQSETPISKVKSKVGS